MGELSGTTRPGGRTARTRERVLSAVRELLAAPDAPFPTVSDVAVRAGVNSVTIYRRWGTVEALVLDVAVTDVNRDSPLEATGDLRADLLAWARRLVAEVSRPEGLTLFHAIAAAARASAAWTGATGLDDLLQPRLDQFQAVLDADGTSGLTPYDVVDLILAPVYLAVLFSPSGRLAGTVDPERLVDNLVAVRDQRAAGRAATARG